MQPILDDETLGRWLGWVNLVGGTVWLLIALRVRDRIARTFIPPALMAIAAGLLKLLGDVVPEPVLLPIFAIVLVVLFAWSWRELRRYRAYVRELKKSRNQA
ncbi:MAG TPA: hypothetical protein VJN96_09675 [Vicinamibacterales bacterium]|nr:hypothetical protein [Vicinamibacterales bacterium]